MHCTHCGTALPDGSRFCSACGLDLHATTPIRRLATGEASEADLVREALKDEYDQFAELGRGGMGMVMLAHDTILDVPVAVKLVPEVVLAFEYRGSSEDIGVTVHSHPTLSEATKEAALAVLGRSIHI